MRTFKYDAVDALVQAGIAWDDAVALRRISRTLRGWFEHECNGAIWRDEETGIPFWYNTQTGQRLFRAPDRESGAIKRLKATMANYTGLSFYVQGDPRGCALYILRPGDVPDGAGIDTCYSSGIAVF